MLEFVILIHFAFVLFVVLGGLLALKWRWMAFVHIPAAIWGALVEMFGWICPLTPWENELRHAAGQAGYQGGFIENYLMPVIYPDYLNREVQILMGAAVVLINVIVYWFVYK